MVTVSLKKIKKWKPFMSSGELKRWRREASPRAMLTLKGRRREGNWGTWRGGDKENPSVGHRKYNWLWDWKRDKARGEKLIE